VYDRPTPTAEWVGGGTRGGPPPAPEPAMADAALLSDAGLVLEHQAQALARMCSGNRPQALTEPP